MTDITTAAQMREAAARLAKAGWLDSRRHVIGDAERECELCEEIAAAIRAIPCAGDAEVDALKAEVARLREALAAEAADAKAARKQLRELRAALIGGKP